MKLSTLRKYKHDARWKNLNAGRARYQKDFEGRINLPLRNEIRDMLKEDQKRALRVALTPSKKWRAQYTNRKFVPNNRKQVRRINQLLDDVGYPGEKIIGAQSWATVIISHNEHDTIYNQLRPKLYAAFERGELSAIELAIIETWRIAVDTDRQEKGFVIWSDTITKAESLKADSLRQSLGLRTIALNNALIRSEKELGMNFFLSPFHGGHITIQDPPPTTPRPE